MPPPRSQRPVFSQANWPLVLVKTASPSLLPASRLSVEVAATGTKSAPSLRRTWTQNEFVSSLRPAALMSRSNRPPASLTSKSKNRVAWKTSSSSSVWRFTIRLRWPALWLIAATSMKRGLSSAGSTRRSGWTKPPVRTVVPSSSVNCVSGSVTTACSTPPSPRVPTETHLWVSWAVVRSKVIASVPAGTMSASLRVTAPGFSASKIVRPSFGSKTTPAASSPVKISVRPACVLSTKSRSAPSARRRTRVSNVSSA